MKREKQRATRLKCIRGAFGGEGGSDECVSHEGRQNVKYQEVTIFRITFQRTDDEVKRKGSDGVKEFEQMDGERV